MHLNIFPGQHSRGKRTAISITNDDFGDGELIEGIDEPSDDIPDLFTAYVWHIGYRALENHVLGELSRCTFCVT